MQEQLDDLTVRYGEAQRSSKSAQTSGDARMKEVGLRLRRAEENVGAFERQQQEDLKQVEDAIKFDEAELKYRREDVEAKRRLAKKGLIPGTDLERAEAALKAAEFALSRSQTDLSLKRSQSQSDVIDRRRTVNDTTRDMSRARDWSQRESRMAGNELDTMDLQLARAQEDMKKTVLTAPVGGLVVLSSQGGWRGESRLPRLGDWVSQGREVASVVSLARMEVQLELSQEEITGVRMGQIAEVTVEALPGKVLKGKVTSIGQNARRPPIQGWMGMSATATFPVVVDLPPIGKALIRPGMRATVRLEARRIKDAVVVPSGCVFRRDGSTLVYAERKGKFVPVKVVTGATNGDYTAITQGLKAGERIALNDLGAPAETTPAAKSETPQKAPRP